MRSAYRSFPRFVDVRHTRWEKLQAVRFASLAVLQFTLASVHPFATPHPSPFCSLPLRRSPSLHPRERRTHVCASGRVSH